MRSFLTRRALAVLPILLLVGCRSTGSSWQAPKWSQLNPFSWSSGETPTPPTPSSLAAVGSAPSAEAGYAATSDRAGQDGYSAAPASWSTSPSTQYSYPSTSAGSLAGSSGPTGSMVSANPATTPQSGYYDTGSGYRQLGQSAPAASGYSPSRSGYSASTGTNSYRSPASASSAPAGSGYKTAEVAGSYGSAAGAASRYGAVSGRYGLDGSTSGPSSAESSSPGTTADAYRSYPNYNNSPKTSPPSLNPQYQGAANSSYGVAPDASLQRDSSTAGVSTADSRYAATAGFSYGHGTSGAENYTSGVSRSTDTGGSDLRTASGSRDGSESSSLVGDRYARADSDSARSGYNSYRNGQLSNSSGDRNWKPGQTGYEPGNTGYEPGNTGYTPPGVSPYRPPATSWPQSPYLPGSTKLYTPPTADGSETRRGSDSSAPPSGDSHVIPALHVWR